MACGNVMSDMAVTGMLNAFLAADPNTAPSDLLLDLLRYTLTNMKQSQQRSRVCASTTLLAALIDGHDMYFVSIGDSRLYLYRCGMLLQLNRERI